MVVNYQRAIIAVEKKLGFLYVPAVGQKLMPITNKKISVFLEGERQSKLLSYNAEHKRIFGLTEWYNKMKIVPGSLLHIELDDSVMRVNLTPSNLKTTTKKAVADDLVDISGLSSIAKGNIVEDRIKELILLYGQGLLNVYKPVIDDRGIDMIVMRDGVFMPIYLQIKSRFNASKREQLLIELGDKTFTAHNCYYIVGASFNPSTLELDDKLLFVPSTHFEEKALGIKGYNKKRITVSMKDKTKAYWAQYFIPKDKLVEALMEKFAEIERYIK